LTVADGSEVGFGAGSVNGAGLLTTMLYKYGPTVWFVTVSFTVTLNVTVVAEVGVPVMCCVGPLRTALKPSAGRPVMVQL
jgi:hypothetical protein